MISADPGSFRDPASRVYVQGDRVIRALDQRGLDAWRRIETSEFLAQALSEGLIVPTKEIGEVPDGASGALEHPRLPMITYPYEWTFSMLRAAALLQLELLERALADGLIIKDSTPFNIQFISGEPVFIDLGSFEPYRNGEQWIGYRQFTRQFLFPLLMRAWAGVPFQPWVRGNPEGPTAADMRSMLSLRRRLKPAAALHVSLQARMEERMSGTPVRQDLREAGFTPDLIVANVRRLRKLIQSLEWDPGNTEWVAYQECAHVERDRDAKAEFLSRALERSSPGRVVDLGANDGFFSEIAAEAGAHAIAVDGDEGVLEAFYPRSRGKDISIVVTDLANPSPSQGWAGAERPSLRERANPGLVVAYGLIHHLIYTSSIPPESVLDWLRSFDCDVVVEFVSPDDEMVGILTANKLESELHVGRTLVDFEGLISARFEVNARQPLEGGTRVLFDLTPAR